MAKNQLQAWCQKQGHPLPTYYATQTGSPHKPEWSSTVTIILDKLSSSFFGEVASTKKEAEANAARKVLDLIQSSSSTLEHHAPKIKVTKKTAIMVDVENMPRLISQLPIFEGPVTIFAFVGKHHHSASVDYGSEVIKILSPSTRPDGTDTCMQVHAGRFLMEGEYELYLIATRDHFGGALVEMITSDEFSWNAKKAILITSVEHVLEGISRSSSL